MNDLDLKIEQGIPLPPRSKSNGTYAAIRNVMLKMQTGDSFYFKFNGHKAASMRTAIGKLAKEVGVSIAIRVNQEDGLRVWKVEE